MCSISFDVISDVNMESCGRILSHRKSYDFAIFESFSFFISYTRIQRQINPIFHRFYKSSKTQPAANLVFLLSSGGQFNYFGTKKWLEDHLDASSSSDSELLSDVKFSICLDSLGNVDVSEGAAAAASLNMHVSKPPKEDSHAGKFLAALKSLTEQVKAANR